MELYRSKIGEINTREHWEAHLNRFWDEFKSAGDYAHNWKWPKRPDDAWERYVKVVGLVKV